jgi:YVTN family beta-propeller protein
MKKISKEIAYRSIPSHLRVVLLSAGIIAGVLPPGMAQPAANQIYSLDALPKNTVVATLNVGTNPFGLAVTPNSDFVYVANYTSDTVSVIQTSVNSVVATIPVGSGPYLVAITPDGQTVFVSNAAGGTVSVISTATNTVVQTLTVSSPGGLAVSPDGTQLYVASASDGVYIIDSSTFATLNVLNPGGSPFDIRFTADGVSAYVLNWTGVAFLYQIDTASQTIPRTNIGLGDFRGFPQGLAITPDAATLYVTNAKNYVIAINVADGSLKKKIVIFSKSVPGNERTLGDLAVTPDGKFLYVANNLTDTVTMLGTTRNRVIGTPIAVGNASHVAAAPNGNYLYVTDYTNNTVTVIDITP